MKRHGISPIDLRQMEFYEIEYLIKEMEEDVEEENKRNKTQEREYEKMSKSAKLPNIGKTNYGGFPTPKLPTLPKFK